VSFGAGALADPAGQFVLFARMLPSSLVSEMSGPATKSPIWIIPARGATAGSIPQRFVGSTPAEYAAFNSSLQNISPPGSPTYDTKSIFCPLNFFKALNKRAFLSYVERIQPVLCLPYGSIDIVGVFGHGFDLLLGFFGCISCGFRYVQSL